MLVKVGVENYINNYEQGGMQLDPHPHKDNINTPAYQTGNSNFLTTRKNQFSTTRKETSLGMERVHALAQASFINLNTYYYESNES